jgi:hypothetical protein
MAITMNIRSLVIATASVLVVSAASAEVLEKCGCQAARNVKNRLCETRAAQREFWRLNDLFVALEKAQGAPVQLDTEIKGNIEKCGTEAITTADDAMAQSATSGTGRTCEIDVPQTTRTHLPPSHCIAQSVYKHEELHREACLRRQSGKWERIWAGRAPVISGINTLWSMSVVDYLAEETAAYMLEESNLTETLKQLVATCSKAELMATVEEDDYVPGKKKGDVYHFDLSLQGCPTRTRKSPSVCPY